MCLYAAKEREIQNSVCLGLGNGNEDARCWDYAVSYFLSNLCARLREICELVIWADGCGTSHVFGVRCNL